MISKKITFTLLFASLFSACSTDSFSDLIEVEPIQNVTYTNNVKSIIDSHCLSCHGTIPSNGAPMSLITYNNVKEAVLNLGLLDRISRADGAAGAMPLGGPRLPQNNIAILNQWSSDGLLE